MSTSSFTIICLSLLIFSPAKHASDALKPNIVIHGDLNYRVNFYLFTKTRVDDPERYTASYVLSEKQLYKSFDPTKPVKILIHGWMFGETGPSMQMLKNAYLPALDYNIIVADWTSESLKFYTTARYKVPLVGKTVAAFVRRLVNDYSLDLNDLHILGHSLGSHIAHVAGIELNSKVGRITGLDPAAPLFSGANDRMNKSCAQFVDIVHTCDNLLSISDSLGHVDFFPNGGSAPQPGCIPMDLLGGWCSHRKSSQFYAETVQNPKAFPALTCDSWKKYKENECSGKEAYMGEHVSRDLSGDYYLKTNRESPFGQGENVS